MLTRVLALVQAEGWFDTATPFEKTIYLTHGAAHGAVLGRNGQPDTFVKFTEDASLALEAARCRHGSDDFRGIAPRYLGHVARPALEVLVTQAESHSPVTADRLRAAGVRARLQAGLERYFELMRAAGGRTPPAPDEGGWFDDLVHYFAAASRSPAAADALALLRAERATLPPMRQHGDLVANNLGLRPDGSLVVFDWEDYGAVDLSGLDLFTLEMSLGGAMEVQPAPAHRAAPPIDVARCCAALGLAPDVYRRLAPAYALVFRYLKRNYSPEVRERVDALLASVSRSRDAGARR